MEKKFEIINGRFLGVRLHVGGLPKNITQQEVADRFKSFGEVKGVELIKDQFDGKL